MVMIGKSLVEAEEQLQQVMAGLQRFQRAAEGLERGQTSLEAAARQVERLAEQASSTLAPALEAVATLRRLDPDGQQRIAAAVAFNRKLLLTIVGILLLNTLLLLMR